MIDPLLVTATVITLGAGAGLIVVAVQYREDFASMWYDLRDWARGRRTLRQLWTDYRDNKHGVHLDAGLELIRATPEAEDLANPPAPVEPIATEPEHSGPAWRLWPRYIGRVTFLSLTEGRFAVIPTWRRWTAFLAERQIACDYGPTTSEFAAIVGPLPSVGPREEDIPVEARRVVWLEEKPWNPERVYQPALFEADVS